MALRARGDASSTRTLSPSRAVSNMQACRAKQFAQALSVDGLREVVIEACRKRLGLVFMLSPTRYGDECHGSTEGALTHLAGDLVAVQFRHTDIQKGNFRLHRRKSGYRLFPTVHDHDLMAIYPQEYGETLRRISIVVGNEHPATYGTRAVRSNSWFSRKDCGISKRQPYYEFATAPYARASCLELLDGIPGCLLVTGPPSLGQCRLLRN
jgi:hypothetical protein